MSHRSRQEYLAVLRERYQKTVSKKERSLIINEALTNTSLHRKSLIRALKEKDLGAVVLPKLGRRKKYSNECVEVLKKLYRASEFICSDKLRAMIPVLINQSEFTVEESVLKEVLAISAASIDRYLRTYRGIERRRRNSGTRPGSLLFKKMIPLKSLNLIAPGCGILQADTVAHCGTSLAGEFIWSLTMTDEYSGWTENRAAFTKSANAVLPAIESIHLGLPFEIELFNVDNGSEFLNHRIYEYFLALSKQKVIPFPMTRSRSYQKNDNAHVEQKNWTTVRQLFGYDRFEFRELVPVMNEIYRVQGLIQNFFVPQFKLRSKARIGAKIRKKYDQPITPYERVLNDGKITDEKKEALTARYQTLNYFELTNRKEELLAHFIKLHTRLRSEKQGSTQGSLLRAVR